MFYKFLTKFELIELYSEGMVKLKVTLYQLSCYLQVYIPEIYVHLKDLGIELSTFAS